MCVSVLYLDSSEYERLKVSSGSVGGWSGGYRGSGLLLPSVTGGPQLVHFPGWSGRVERIFFCPVGSTRHSLSHKVLRDEYHVVLPKGIYIYI